MNYLVMECHPGYAILLDEEGRFLKAANLHYKVGQTVRDPVLMRTERRRRRAGSAAGSRRSRPACCSSWAHSSIRAICSPIPSST